MNIIACTSARISFAESIDYLIKDKTWGGIKIVKGLKT